MEVDQSVVLLHVVVQSEQYVTGHGQRERERYMEMDVIQKFTTD